MFKPNILALCAALAAAMPAVAQSTNSLIDDLGGLTQPPPQPTPRVWWKGDPKVSTGSPWLGRIDHEDNWTPSLKDADDLGFGDARVSTDLVNGRAGFRANSITFAGGTAYNIVGNAITLIGGLYNGSNVRQTISATLLGGAPGAQLWDGGGAGINVHLADQVANRLTFMNVNATVSGSFTLRRDVVNTDYGNGVALDMTYGTFSTPAGANIHGGLENASMKLVRTTWHSGNTLTVGGGRQSAVVELQKSALIDAHDLRIADNGRITLSGGDLAFDTLARSGNGMLDWQRGSVHARGPLELGALGSVVSLNNDRLLQVDGPLTVSTGQTLVMSGKSLLKAPELRLAGGVLQASVLGGEVPRLSGHGQWLGRVGGGTTVNASGGLLRIGDATQAGAVMLTGPVTVAAGASLQLDSLDLARLSSSTTLADGSLLTSSHGIALAAGQQLFARGKATVQGSFVNDGTLTARPATGGRAGWLTLDGDVSGTGRFVGAFSFLAGLNPGAHLGADVGVLGFGGGEVWLGPQSSLTLDIANGANGWTGDRLDRIGLLHAGGELHLRFHGVAPRPGDSWQALDFTQPDGRFSRITVEGLDGWQVDGAQLLATGRISVSAVPEPAGAALWLAGTGMLALARRRKAADAGAGRCA